MTFVLKHVLLSGASGRMGQEITQLLGGSGSEVTSLLRGGQIDKRASGMDVLIDFSHPLALELVLKTALDLRLPLLVGTTGLSDEQLDSLKKAGQDVPVLYSPNTVIAISILKQVVAKLACLWPDVDIEISEAHHRYKKDSPSGTALMLGKSIAKEKGWEFGKVAVFDRAHALLPKPYEQINFSVQRGGNMPGEHTVRLITEGEEISITHRTFSRTIFAKGSLALAAWLKTQPAGFYSMDDYLASLEK